MLYYLGKGTEFKNLQGIQDNRGSVESSSKKRGTGCVG